MGRNASVVVSAGLVCVFFFALATNATAQDDPRSLIQQALALWDVAKQEAGVSDTALRAKALLEQVADQFAGTEEAADALRHLAYGHYRKGMKDEAMSYYDRLFTEYRTSYARARAWLDLNGFAAAEGRNEEAIRYCQEVVANFAAGEEVANAKFDIGRNYMGLARSAEAVEWFKRVLAEHPGTRWADEAKREIARNYVGMGRLTEALPWFERVAREHPDSKWAAEALRYIGGVRAAEGKYAEAAAMWRQVLGREPAGALAAALQIGIARCRGFAGDVEGALALLDALPSDARAKDAMRDDSMQASADLVRAEILQHAGRDLDAHQAFQALRQKWPATYEAARGALLEGDWYMHSGQPREALSLYIWAASNQYQPDDERAHAWFEAGRVHTSLGSRDDAAAAFRAAISAAPLSSWAQMAAQQPELSVQQATGQDAGISILQRDEADRVLGGTSPYPMTVNYYVCDSYMRCERPCRYVCEDSSQCWGEKIVPIDDYVMCRAQTAWEKSVNPQTCTIWDVAACGWYMTYYDDDCFDLKGISPVMVRWCQIPT